MNNDIVDKFQQRKAEYKSKLSKTQNGSNLISTFRFLLFIAASGLLGFGVYSTQYYYGYYALIILFVFIGLVIMHSLFKAKIILLEKMVEINENALLRLAGKWTTFTESGEKFVDHGHPYTTDLNIFGQGSLFQYINTTCSFIGEQTLAKHLSSSAPLEEIKPRQEAVLELSSRLDFRQHFQAVGADEFFKNNDLADLLSWSEEQALVGYKKLMGYICLLPALTLTLLVAGLFFDVPLYYFVISLSAQVIITVAGEIIVSKTFSKTEKAAIQLKRYVKLLRCIKAEEFKAPFLLKLKQKLKTDPHTALKQIKVLSKIADRLHLRHAYPGIYHPVNAAFLWDIYTFFKLERWKRKVGPSLRTWFNVVGEFEALSSLAILAHYNPDWIFPQVENGFPRLEAKALGHPLISDGLRVGNDICLPQPGLVWLITGSNMSGKSTLLRTAGINLVLAYAGAPVCAEKMLCSMMNVYSKMQVHDNLEEKVSTFYAELKRMKMIIDAAKTQDPLIFLLDEIFRGTNSRDRIFATSNVIKQLQRLSAIGLVTTHDLELSVLEEECVGNIFNYHFTDKIQDGRIYFDYKLKHGVSQTANALALMKMIGIEVEE